MTKPSGDLRIGVVGLGLAASSIIPSISKMEGANVVACCDIDARQAATFAERYGVVDIP